MNIEALESRIAPAAIVTVTGGNLNISFAAGDASSNITVTAFGGGDYDVYDDSTVLDTVYHGVTKGINYTGTAGQDFVTFIFSAGPEALRGKLSVKTLGDPTNGDYVNLFDGQVRGGVAVDFGTAFGGNHSLEFSNTFISNGKVSVTGPTIGGLSVTNNGYDVRLGATKIVNAAYCSLQGIRVSGGLTVDNTNLQAFDTYVDLGGAVVAGGVKVVGGNGNESVYLSGTTIGGGANLTLGDGNNSVTVGSSYIGGTLNVLSGNGGDTIEMYGGGGNGGSIGGKVNLALGEGFNSLNFDAYSVGGGLKYAGAGQSADSVSIYTEPYGHGPAGGINILLGGGGGYVSATIFNELSKLAIVGGAAQDSVSLSGSAPSMAVTMKLGGGFDSVFVDWDNIEALSVKIDGEADGGSVNLRPVNYWIPTTLTNITEF